MNNPDNMYNAYKRNRKFKQAPVTDIAGNKPMDDIEELYLTYRLKSAPDHQAQIAAVMKVADQMIANEKMAESIVHEVVTSDGSVHKSKQLGILATVFNAPSAILGRIKTAVDTYQQNWNTVIPAAAAAVLCAAVVGYVVKSPDVDQPGQYELAQHSNAVTEYLDGTVDNQLGFSGNANPQVRDFYLGVSAINLEISHSAEDKNGISSILNQISALLDSEESTLLSKDVEALTDKLNKSSTLDETITAGTSGILKTIENESASHWLKLGKDIQSVYLASLLAIDQNITHPLDHAIAELEQSVSRLEDQQFSEQELKAVSNILSFSEKEQFNLDHLRSVRDSARDFKALKLISGM